MTEKNELKGIYVRIGHPESEVIWLNEEQVIERAYREAAETGDSISDVLLTNQVTNLHYHMYDEYGAYQGDKHIRSITAREAIRFLGRFLQICRLLTTQEEATRFVRLLEDGADAGEHQVAKQIRVMISRLPKRVIPHEHPHHNQQSHFGKPDRFSAPHHGSSLHIYH